MLVQQSRRAEMLKQINCRIFQLSYLNFSATPIASECISFIIRIHTFTHRLSNYLAQKSDFLIIHILGSFKRMKRFSRASFWSVIPLIYHLHWFLQLAFALKMLARSLVVLRAMEIFNSKMCCNNCGKA